MIPTRVYARYRDLLVLKRLRAKALAHEDARRSESEGRRRQDHTGPPHGRTGRTADTAGLRERTRVNDVIVEAIKNHLALERAGGMSNRRA